MIRLSCEPRSPEWHAIRSEAWTASLAAVLVAKDNAELLKAHAASKGIELDIAPLLAVGLDSFYDHTLWTTWASKVGRIPTFRGNDHTERGITHEEKVIQSFETAQLMMVEREVTATHTADPWLLASFDAVAPASSDTSVVAPNGFPVEAKCPAFPSRKKLWDSKKAGKLAIMGLPYYWCQVQHQIAVSDAPYAWFAAAGIEVDPDTGVEKEEVSFPIYEKVPRDDVFLKAYLAAAKYYFDEFIYSYTEPPKLPFDIAFLKRLAEQAEFDKAIIEGDHDCAVDIYLESLREEEAAIRRRKELEARVLASAAAIKAEGSGVMIVGETQEVVLAERLRVIYSTSKTISWQKVAKALSKKAGLTDVPAEILTDCESKPKESVKLKEVV